MTGLDVGDYVIIAWTVLHTWLTLLYGLRSRWYASDAGKVLFTSFWCTSVALMQVSITLVTDAEYWGRDVIRPIAYGLGALATLFMLLYVLKMQRKDRSR
jgi:hypothetical protein